MTTRLSNDRVLRLVEILGLAGVYFVVGRLALLLAIPPGYATAIWPAAGLALAGTLLLGGRVWPGIFLGSFLVNVGTSFDASSASALSRSLLLPGMIAAGASLQAVVGARLVRRFTSTPTVLGTEANVLRLLALGGPVSCLVNAAVGVASLAVMGSISTHEIPFSWWTWWVGDTIGVLIFAPLVLMWAPRATRIAVRRKVLVSVPLICTFVVVVTLFVRASAQEQKRIDLEFERRTGDLAVALSSNIDADLEVLEFLGGLFSGSPRVGRSDIRKYTRRLLSRHPDIQVLTWNPYIPQSERAGYEQAVRASGDLRFEIREIDESGALARAAERAEYAPVHFIEPYDSHKLALGFDAASDPARADTLRRARDTGEVAASGRIRSVFETRGEPAVIFVLPVYSGDVVPDWLEERRVRLEGFATGILALGDMLDAVLEGGERDGLGIRLWDVTSAEAPQLLDRIDWPAEDESGAVPDRPDGAPGAGIGAAEIQIAGRRWSLQLFPSSKYLAAQRSWQAWSLLAAGLLFTGILGAFLLVVTERTVRVEEVVAQRTDELRNANNVLRREIQKRVMAQKIANVDPLTELLNRRGLEAELTTEIQRARRTGAPLMAVLLDCDDFKRINETLGHAVGDVVLKEVASRLKESLRPTDHLARIGGDEFLVLLPHTRLAEAAHVAERLRLSVADSPMRLNSGPVRLTASLGIERVSTEIASIEEVLAHSHLALRRSKQAGKNRVSSSSARGALGRRSLRGVVDALRRPDSFRAVKQAILSLADEAVVGWEFLSRGPAGSFEMPGDFLRVALERNILTLVDLNCLRSCLQAARDLPDDMLRHVNLFPSTLLDTPQERLVELFPSDRGRNRFCVEVSEHQFIGDPACLRAPVRALKDAGIRLAIDDVGYGRSSLESLILLEPDVVKIDQKVVKGAARDQVQERSLRRLVALVRAVGCELVAEGIESREDLDLLRALGVPHGQGFLWGEPA
jgi:diguanylate cyclase (GGDEF)-like protein